MNARADFQQQQDQERQEAEALQALMEVAAAGCTEQAETLAYLCGLGTVWKQQLQPRGVSRGKH